MGLGQKAVEGCGQGCCAGVQSGGDLVEGLAVVAG